MQGILAQEIETLKEIYLNELIVVDNLNDNFELNFNLTPTTGEKIDEKWVSMTLCIYLPTEYPLVIPTMKIFNPRGLLEDHTNRVLEKLKNMAEDRIGFQMIFELVEHAKEMLTIYNIPHVQCMICLEDLSTSSSGTYVKTSCLHFFHRYCLYRYVQFIKDNLQSSEDQTHGVTAISAVPNYMICPICRDDISKDYPEKSYSFKNEEDQRPNDKFVYIPDENMLQLQHKMKNLMDMQRSKGGIIDEEVEKKKFDLPKDFVFQGLKQKEQLEKEKLKNEILKKESEMKIANQKSSLNNDKRIFKHKHHYHKNQDKCSVNKGKYLINTDQSKDYHLKGNYASKKYQNDDNHRSQNEDNHGNTYSNGNGYSSNKNNYEDNNGYQKNYDNRSSSSGVNLNNFIHLKNKPSGSLSNLSTEIDDIIIDLTKKGINSSMDECTNIIDNNLSVTEVNRTNKDSINISYFHSVKTNLVIDDGAINVDPILENNLRHELGKQEKRNEKINCDNYSNKYNGNRYYTNYKNKPKYNLHNQQKVSEFKDESKTNSTDIKKIDYSNYTNEDVDKTSVEKCNIYHSEDKIANDEIRNDNTNIDYKINYREQNNYKLNTNYSQKNCNMDFMESSSANGQTDVCNSKIGQIRNNSNKRYDGYNSNKYASSKGNQIVDKKNLYNANFSKASNKSKSSKIYYYEDSKRKSTEPICSNVSKDNNNNINLKNESATN